MTPLRILILLNLEWNPRLGAVRVYYELAQQWRTMGHQVSHFSLSEAFPKRSRSRIHYAVRQLLFHYKAARFVRKNSNDFDVIDALIESVAASKKELGFNGLLVARSVGLYRLYERFDEQANRRRPQRQRGKFVGRIFYGAVRRMLRRVSDHALNHADLINVPNQTEAECIRRELGSGYRVLVEPYGLTREQRSMLEREALPAVDRLKQNKVCFVGMWVPRKGAYDWPQIVARVRQQNPSASFCFLGTMVDSKKIIEQLGSASSKVECVSEYGASELPKLLADCTVAAFPSYVEGFGLAVLEQLAAGIPTVAFDVPGPATMLKAALPELLVPVGDIDALSSAVARILNATPSDYDHLSKRCTEAASHFDWTRIAQDTIECYRQEKNGAPSISVAGPAEAVLDTVRRSVE